VIKPDMQADKRVLIVAHGNSLRALVKYFEGLSEAEIVEVNIPTGIPLVYEFSESFKIVKKYYLGNEEAIAEKMNQVANQGKSK
jgi:2,3-bisphosphoglycerate-dependent phosphoglycerate mutase